MRRRRSWLAGVAVLALVAASCSGGEADETTTTAAPPPTTEAPTATTETPTATTEVPTSTTEAVDEHEGEPRLLDAPVAEIVVDGDVSDWAAVTGLSLTLEAIDERSDDPVEDKDVTIRMAHDADMIYALFTVEDDYDWVADDHNLSAALAVMFPVGAGGGPHMGAEDHEGEPSLGMVDIWHWELDCAAGELNGGGAGHPAGDGKDPGNDSVCNFDDEWATDAETREDDNTATGENSLTGVWWHSNPVDNAPGTWFFEMSRPLDTGDEQDGLFAVGESTLLALAYWDADFGPDGWDDSTHVQSSNQGWIEVHLD